MGIWDKDLKVGDIIKAERAGIHEVVSIERRFFIETDRQYLLEGENVGDEYNSIIFYRQILTSDLKLFKSKHIYNCDVFYCEKITKESAQKELEEKITELTDGYNTLMELL